MAKILALPDDVIGQIAAGEVVERPAAAIKELVENSLDAGATAVTVDIKGGGSESFRVTDNGSGIDGGDLKMAFERHATSKIRSAEDLYRVHTLGFRGEALASIAAVSRTRLTTRTAQAETGFMIEVEGGDIRAVREASSPLGTAITVRDLFYNAPVRLKFLKKPAYETAAVTELMARLILSRPDISFRYLADGKTVYSSPGDGQLKSALMSVYGLDVLKAMTPVRGMGGGVIVDGYIGVGDVARANRSQEYFFINRRVMKSPLLSGAVETACRQRVMIGRFPMCALNLTMPFESADVNVHPNKWEVRFQNEQAVREAVESAVLEALERDEKEDLLKPRLFVDPLAGKARPAEAEVRAQPVRTAQTPAPQAAGQQSASDRQSASERQPDPVSQTPPAQAAGPISGAAPVQGTAPVRTAQALQGTPPVPPAPPRPVSAFHSAPTPMAGDAEPPAPEKRAAPPQPEAVPVQEAITGLKDDEKPRVRLIGTAFLTYILFEYGDQLVLCDQHAAHERLLYERLMRETSLGPQSQTLLIPLTMKISATEYATYLDNRERLRYMGFDLDTLGEDTLLIRGLPVVLGQVEAPDALRDILSELNQFGRVDDYDKKLRIAATACRHAVKGGEKVSDEELTWLVTQILNSELPPTCPHGRPLMVTVSRTDLDKRFRRIQQSK